MDDALLILDRRAVGPEDIAIDEQRVCPWRHLIALSAVNRIALLIGGPDSFRDQLSAITGEPGDVDVDERSPSPTRDRRAASMQDMA